MMRRSPGSKSATGATTTLIALGCVRVAHTCPTREHASEPATRTSMASRLGGTWRTFALGGGRPNRLPHPHRRGGHLDVVDAKVRDGVDDRVPDRGRGADRPGLADALRAERVQR